MALEHVGLQCCVVLVRCPLGICSLHLLEVSLLCPCLRYQALVRVTVCIRRSILARSVPRAQLAVEQLPLVSSRPPVLLEQGLFQDPDLLAALLEQVVAVKVVLAPWQSFLLF